TIPHAGNKLAGYAGWTQRQSAIVAGHGISLTHQASHPHLHSLHRRIDITCGTAGAGLFAKHIPWFDGLSKFHLDTVVTNRTVNRKTKFNMRIEPCRFEVVPATM